MVEMLEGVMKRVLMRLGGEVGGTEICGLAFGIEGKLVLNKV